MAKGFNDEEAGKHFSVLPIKKPCARRKNLLCLGAEKRQSSPPLEGVPFAYVFPSFTYCHVFVRVGYSLAAVMLHLIVKPS